MEKIFIFSGKIARDLLKNGYNIIDIAENQQNKKYTVFIFTDTSSIREYLKSRWNITIK